MLLGGLLAGFLVLDGSYYVQAATSTQTGENTSLPGGVSSKTIETVKQAISDPGSVATDKFPLFKTIKGYWDGANQWLEDNVGLSLKMIIRFILGIFIWILNLTKTILEWVINILKFLQP